VAQRVDLDFVYVAVDGRVDVLVVVAGFVVVAVRVCHASKRFSQRRVVVGHSARLDE
jgi:hypothetical protein